MTTSPAKRCGEQQLVMKIYLFGFGGFCLLWVGWFLFVWGFLFGWFDFWFCLFGFFSIEENNGLIFEKNPAWLLLI